MPSHPRANTHNSSSGTRACGPVEDQQLYSRSHMPPHALLAVGGVLRVGACVLCVPACVCVCVRVLRTSRSSAAPCPLLHCLLSEECLGWVHTCRVCVCVCHFEGQQLLSRAFMPPHALPAVRGVLGVGAHVCVCVCLCGCGCGCGCGWVGVCVCVCACGSVGVSASMHVCFCV